MARPRAATWVTRTGVHVDRIASAWLIRRFIDPQARFKFVPAKGYAPEADELRFDMFEAEFTHAGDRCTFEVLVERMGLREVALAALGEIVHDLDLRDEKFHRDETAGVRSAINRWHLRERARRRTADRGGGADARRAVHRVLHARRAATRTEQLTLMRTPARTRSGNPDRSRS